MGPNDGDHAPDPADEVMERDEMARLLARLPPKQQAVLALRYAGGLDDASIAVVCTDIGSGPHTLIDERSQATDIFTISW